MPTALMCTLRPAAAATVPANLSRATHAAVLHLIGAADADLATRIHNDDGPKPLTVSNVLGMPRTGTHVAVSPTQTYGLRVTTLTAPLEQFAQTWVHAPPAAPLDLDGTAWHIAAVTADPAADGWAGSTTYDAIARAAMHADPLPTRWTFEFAAPLTFRQSGKNQPFPLPELVFGSLLDRWNAFAPVALPDEVRRFAAEVVAVSRYELRSVREPAKHGAFQVGALGWCSYSVLRRDRHWLTCLEMLAQYAFYSGIGAATTRGYGRARLRPSA